MLVKKFELIPRMFLVSNVKIVGASEISVLVLEESGTGKN
jgi:transcriptional regulator with GAF, ATPase, and Fis domain